ncbi:MAG: N-acetylmuramoyl-L-alanine amidase [Pseudonocardiales bacterium]|nr:N-acetylmuramoyl-L-alanine amidase [Pseudonocardiales bacterium]
MYARVAFVTRRLLVVPALAAVLLAGCTSAQHVAGSPETPAVTSTSAVATTAATTTTAAARSTVPRSTPARSSAPTTTAVRVPPPPVAVPNVSYPPGSGPLVVLNPGHNGGNASHEAEIAQPVPAGFGEYKACDTTGTNTVSGYTEHAFNWDVTLRVRAILQAHGVRVVLTRPNDTGVGPCVDQRAAIGNAPGVAAVISIHSDGTASGAGQGFHVCEDSRPPAGAAVAAQSHALTVAVHDALLHGSGLGTSTYIGRNGYYPRSDLAGLNLAVRPATFLELGNMRNASDAALLTSATGRARIAAAVAAGILAYLG